MITTAHAHKSGVIFHFFSKSFQTKKFKSLRPKMTKIASRGGPALTRANLISRQCPAKIHRKLKIHTVAWLSPSVCAQLYRFKMAPGYPGIGGLQHVLRKQNRTSENLPKINVKELYSPPFALLRNRLILRLNLVSKQKYSATGVRPKLAHTKINDSMRFQKMQ